MVRQTTTARISFADSPNQIHRPEIARHGAARLLGQGVRLFAAPLVAIGAFLAGALYVILLPVCGIASIAQGLAAGGWRFLRATPLFGPRSRVIRR